MTHLALAIPLVTMVFVEIIIFLVFRDTLLPEIKTTGVRKLFKKKDLNVDPKKGG